MKSAYLYLGLLALLTGLALTTGCVREQAPPSASAEHKGPLTVYADNYPVAYFAERIAGPLATVVLPVPAHRDPAYWKPSSEETEQIQEADLVLLNGADYSKWPTLISLAPSKTVDTSRGFKNRFITIEDAVVHSHGPEGEHSHAGLSTYTWLDPDQAALQAEAIAGALKARLPDHAPEIDGRLEELKADLRSLRDRMQELAAKKSEPLLASHPVYDYLARHCGMKLKSLHWEPDEMPGDEGWKELEELLPNHPAKWIIWEGPPLDSISQRLAGLGINGVVFDCCPNRPESGDYLSVMNENVDQLARIYEYEPDGPSPTPVSQ